MLSPDESLYHAWVASGHDAIENILTHIQVSSSDNYDPVKAHDYYMRTRVLTPRQTHWVAPTTGRVNGAYVPPVAKAKASALVAKPLSKKLSPQQALRSKLQVRIDGLQTRLATLKKTLDDLVQQLKDRKSKSDATTAKAKDKVAHPTASDKAAAAKSSAKYYDKNKVEIATKRKKEPTPKSVAELETQIKNVRAKIVTIRAELTKALRQ